MNGELCGEQLKDRIITMDLMLKSDVDVTIDQLAMTNNVCWYVYALRREDGHVLRRALDDDVEGQIKERLKRTWTKQIEEECEECEC